MLSRLKRSILPLFLGVILGIAAVWVQGNPSQSLAQTSGSSGSSTDLASESSVDSTYTLAQAIDPDLAVERVAEIGFTVADMDEALQFYTEVLPFEVISDVEVAGTEYERLQGVFGLRMRVVQLQLGQEVLELTDYLAPEGLPYPIDSRSNDLWFQHIAIVVQDMDEAYQLLRDHNVQHASTSPQTLPDTIPAAAGISAFYFRDPDGHYLELIHFPEDKGDPRWQEESEELFLGIDHTAIAVSSTEQSLEFYQDLLGLQVAGESENFGTEQEHLNNVFGARLRISGLTAGAGPGIEFLDYLAPDGGRPLPEGTQANDLIHWQTTAVFGGRAHRTEYWMFILFDIIISIGLGLVEGILGIAPDVDQSVLGGIYSLATLIPAIAVGVRRMHDTGRSGWWIIVPFANIVFAATKGTEGENQFGPAPEL